MTDSSRWQAPKGAQPPDPITIPHPTPAGVADARELADFGIGSWSQEAVLVADLADAIPELLRLAGLEVRIPRLEILALESLAERDGKSVDAVLSRELLDIVSAHSDYLATAIPVTAALRWPQ